MTKNATVGKKFYTEYILPKVKVNEQIKNLSQTLLKKEPELKKLTNYTIFRDYVEDNNVTVPDLKGYIANSNLTKLLIKKIYEE